MRNIFSLAKEKNIGKRTTDVEQKQSSNCKPNKCECEPPPCNNNEECCSGYCDKSKNRCIDCPLKKEGERCSYNYNCCSNFCDMSYMKCSAR